VPWDPAFEKLICTYLYPVPAQPLAPDLNLRASGFNSYSLVALLVDIENKYRLKIPVEFVTFEKFETPGALWTMLQKAQAEQQA
jgi:acyl carrier protein